MHSARIPAGGKAGHHSQNDDSGSDAQPDAGLPSARPRCRERRLKARPRLLRARLFRAAVTGHARSPVGRQHGTHMASCAAAQRRPTGDAVLWPASAHTRKGALARVDAHPRGGTPLQGGCSGNSRRRTAGGFLPFFRLINLARIPVLRFSILFLLDQIPTAPDWIHPAPCH